MTATNRLDGNNPLVPDQHNPRYEFVRDYAREQIRYAIMTGRLRPDQIHSAPDIGELLGISANPVRTAMRDLEHDGLVETLRNKGYRVVSITNDDLQEIFELRLLVEAPVMRAIAGVVSDELLSTLEAIVQQMKAALDDADRIRVGALDYEFHRALLGVVRNRRLANFVIRLLVQTLVALQPLYETQGGLTQALDEHAAFVELLRTRDADAVYEHSREHICNTYARLGVDVPRYGSPDRPLMRP